MAPVAVMSIAVSMSPGAAVVSVPVIPVAVLVTITAIPTVAWRWRRRCVVVARRVGVHSGLLGYLVHRLPLVVWPLGVVAGLLLRGTASNRGPCSTASTGTHYRTVATAHGLSHGCARRATNRTTDHCTPLALALGTDRGTCCATDGASNDCALASTHVLAQNRARCSTYAATQQRADVVGIDRCAQGRQRKCAAGKQSGHAHMAAGGQYRSF